MKQHRILSIIIVFVLLLAVVPADQAPVQAQNAAPEITRDTLYVPGEVVVGFNRDLPQAEAQTRAAALASSVGAMVVDQYANMALLSVDPAADVVSLAERLTAQEGVAYAEPNYISWIPEEDPLGAAVQLTEVTRQREDGATITRSVEELKAMRTVVKGKVIATYPNDEWANWGNSEIGHDIIWPNKNASPVVCVIDTGVDDRHPDLKGRIIKGYDFVNNDRVPNDDHGHGTHVSGTIAAKVNNWIGPAGISNGKVLAVKALSSQGWGTDYDIAEAIYYCANNSAVKVINMSLGGSIPTSAEYNALDYAINDRGKLVVAAAGNDSTSYYSYPAGWAEDVTIGNGLLSVGASRRPFWWDDPNLWVDIDGDNTEESSEYFNWDDCATWFSNYGSWVEIVAPGESIYSTTPVSYPFWMNYHGWSSSGYDSWNGTSMATPHVAGAAARTWSFYPTESNAWIHDRLLDSGHTLSTAVDLNVPNGALGYNQIIPSGPGAGGTYGFIDEDTIRAPFCWPEVGGPFGADQDMSNARMLNVASAMDRGGFVAEVTDAATGLPLTGATVTVKHGVTGKTLATAKMTSIRTRFVDLINIPADGYNHLMLVNNKGYTSGSQLFSYGWIPFGGYFWWGTGFQVGVPPKSGTTVVANWDSGHNLDLYTFLPSPPSGVVGSGGSGHVDDVGPGTLMDYPYARWHRDGGGGDYLGVEAITVVNAPRSQYPYYLGPYPNGSYEFFLHDYTDGADLENADPILRVWNNGKNIPVLMDDGYYHIFLTKTVPCGPSESWLKMLTIKRSGPSPVYLGTGQDCGTGSTGAGGVWPYASGNAIYTVSGKE